MKILLKLATIIDASSKHHHKKRDVLIENGVIVKIATSINSEKSTREIALKNLHISKAWFDSSVSFGEPGYEERETITNGLNVAAHSGFGHVAVNANTAPVTDNKAGVQFLLTQANNHPVNLYPVGAVSVGSKGVDLAELYDMHNKGATSFYDYKRPLTNTNLLKIALQYCQSFDGLVQSFPYDASVSPNGIVHEDFNSTQLGLKGIPALAEELQITRDLYLLEYTGGRLHIPTISTKKAVLLIREAKKKGLNVTCSVAVVNLVLTDDTLPSFDTNYKLLPPLRTDDDRKALLKGLKDGTIDGVTSDHDPMDVERKNTEFDHAAFGSIGLESCFGALCAVTDVDTAVAAFTNLHDCFGLTSEGIIEGAKANLTLFDPDCEWTFSKEDILSKSKNAALLGFPMKGKAYGILTNKKILLNQ